METSTLTSVSRTRPGADADQNAESIEFLQPDQEFERVLRYAKGTASRIWLFYHAAHLEAFGRTAPYRGISDEALERVCVILGEDVPNPFRNPEDRRTFTHHADTTRQE